MHASIFDYCMTYINLQLLFKKCLTTVIAQLLFTIILYDKYKCKHLGNIYSMPEEDEEYQESSQEQTESNGKIKWTPASVNSHLHQTSRATPTAPMADLRLSDAELKSRR